MTTFLTIARVLYDKGYQELIDASKFIKWKRKDVVFQWLGNIDEEYPNYVERSTIERDQRDGFISYLGTTTDVREFILNADCIILPSYHEGLSRTLMESIAMGKPVITSNIPGCMETVDDGINGFLCEPRNALSLSNAILKFLSLSECERQRMGVNSRKKAIQTFDIKNVIRAYDDVISEILSKS